MNKRCVSLILAILIMASLIAFCSCDKDHKHEYGEWTIKKAATCTEAGIRSKVCECGDEITEEIPSTGHNFVDGICTDCGAKQ